MRRVHGRGLQRCLRQTAAGEMPELALRSLVVESTQLARAKAPRLMAAQQGKRAVLITRLQQRQRRTFASEADARQATVLCLRQSSPSYYHLTYAVGMKWIPAKRTTGGRPPKDAPRPQRQVWRTRGNPARPAGSQPASHSPHGVPPHA
jgi:hypothetical protein